MINRTIILHMKYLNTIEGFFKSRFRIEVVRVKLKARHFIRLLYVNKHISNRLQIARDYN